MPLNSLVVLMLTAAPVARPSPAAVSPCDRAVVVFQNMADGHDDRKDGAFRHFDIGDVPLDEVLTLECRESILRGEAPAIGASIDRMRNDDRMREEGDRLLCRLRPPGTIDEILRLRRKSDEGVQHDGDERCLAALIASDDAAARAYVERYLTEDQGSLRVLTVATAAKSLLPQERPRLAAFLHAATERNLDRQDELARSLCFAPEPTDAQLVEACTLAAARNQQARAEAVEKEQERRDPIVAACHAARRDYLRSKLGAVVTIFAIGALLTALGTRRFGFTGRWHGPMAWASCAFAALAMGWAIRRLVWGLLFESQPDCEIAGALVDQAVLTFADGMNTTRNAGWDFLDTIVVQGIALLSMLPGAAVGAVAAWRRPWHFALTIAVAIAIALTGTALVLY